VGGYINTYSIRFKILFSSFPHSQKPNTARSLETIITIIRNTKNYMGFQ